MSQQTNYSRHRLIERIDHLHRQINTPALLVDEVRLQNNMMQMQRVASENGKRLRPHIKTHKSIRFARRQIELGACGIAVAKLSEAEVMAGGGIDSILIANQVVQDQKLPALAALSGRVDVCVGIDHVQHIARLAPYFDASNPLKVSIEVDSGLHRCGVQAGRQLVELASEIRSADHLRLSGIFTHAGQVYAAETVDQVKSVALQEARTMAQGHQLLTANGIEVQNISAGSTPAARFLAEEAGISEIRPGNYVFYDMIQVALGSCSEHDCALYVLATVIAQPADRRVVIDAGSKALTLDKGAHGTALIRGHGRLLNLPGTITRLSEEHGIIECEDPVRCRIGQPVLIIPNHACAVVNLYDAYHVIDDEFTITKSPVDARGKSQ